MKGVAGFHSLLGDDAGNIAVRLRRGFGIRVDQKEGVNRRGVDMKRC